MTSPTATAELAADPRVRAGLEAQLAERARRLDAGERSLGWKLGFGAPAARERLGIAAPLIGFLTDRSRFDASAGFDLSGWKHPLLEPEVGVWLGSDVEPDGGPDEAAAAVVRLGPAVELADLDPPPEDPGAILAGNIFHRAVAWGKASALDVAPPTSLSARIEGPGDRLAEVEDAEAATGSIFDLVAHVANLLGHFGERLRGGDLVICGSLVPPLEVTAGDRVAYRLDPVGELAVELR